MNAGRVFAKSILAAGLVGVLTSCGGGGTGGGTPPPPPPALRVTTSSGFPLVMEGVAYNQQLQATGGKAPYVWSQIGGNLPPGITLSTDGTVSGTSTYSEVLTSFDLQAQVRDSTGATANSPYFQIPTVGTLGLQPNTLPEGNVGVNYSGFVAPHAGTPPYQVSLAAGASLPSGLTLTNRDVTGTPTQAGTFQVSIQVKDSGTPVQTYTGDVSIVIDNNLVITSPLNLQVGVQNVPFSAQLTAIGGTLPYTWSLVPGSSNIPAGLNLSSGGLISGTSSVTGPFWLNAQVTDASLPPQTNTKLIYSAINPPISLPDGALADGVVNRDYQLGGIYPQNGKPPYTITLQSGSLPPGLSFTPDQLGTLRIVGTPTSTGTYNFTMQASDSLQPAAVVTGDFTLRVASQMSVAAATLPFGIVGQPYSYQFTASGGVPPYKWNVGSHVDGVNLDPSTGLFSGTPTSPYDGNLYVWVVDSATPAQQLSVSPYVHIPDVLKIGTTVLPSIGLNATANLQLIRSGGTGPFAWSVSSGALPDGLSIDQNGVISGTTSKSGTYTFTLTLSDAGLPNQSASVDYSVKVGAIGRNDSIATASPISNGSFNASISPAVDPDTGLLSPDVDYYKLTAVPGTTVQVDISAARQTPSSPLDSVLEFVDANGVRLQYCSDYGGYGANYNQPCMNDDFPGAETDSRLYLQFPSTLTGSQTFYMKVLDWRGTARPDFFYQMIISGAN